MTYDLKNFKLNLFENLESLLIFWERVHKYSPLTLIFFAKKEKKKPSKTVNSTKN